MHWKTNCPPAPCLTQKRMGLHSCRCRPSSLQGSGRDTDRGHEVTHDHWLSLLNSLFGCCSAKTARKPLGDAPSSATNPKRAGRNARPEARGPLRGGHRMGHGDEASRKGRVQAAAGPEASMTQHATTNEGRQCGTGVRSPKQGVVLTVLWPRLQSVLRGRLNTDASLPGHNASAVSGAGGSIRRACSGQEGGYCRAPGGAVCGTLGDTQGLVPPYPHPRAQEPAIFCCGTRGSLLASEALFARRSQGTRGLEPDKLPPRECVHG